MTTTLSAKTAISELKKLEPAIKEAGNLALRLQKKVKLKKKTRSGNDWADVVTDADSAVQEVILRKFLQTKLSNCRLLAEEKTVLARKFNPRGKLRLSLDPIDGTYAYGNKKPFFSIIVGLHDGENLLYTLKYFPAFNYSLRIIRKDSQTRGQLKIKGPILKKTIFSVYPESDPEKCASKLFSRLSRQGYVFLKRHDLKPLYRFVGTTTLFITGKISGVYHENPGVYDGFVAMHYGMAKNFKIFQGGSSGKVDLGKTITRRTGVYYPGWSLVLRK